MYAEPSAVGIYLDSVSLISDSRHNRPILTEFLRLKTVYSPKIVAYNNTFSNEISAKIIHSYY